MRLEAIKPWYLIACNTLLAAIATLGLLVMAALPPFQAPDEFRHWATALTRSHQLFTGEAKLCSKALDMERILQSSSIGFDSRRKWPSAGFDKLPTAEKACFQDDLYYGSAWTYPAVMITERTFPRMHDDGLRSLHAFYFARLISGLIVLLTIWHLIKVAERTYTVPVPGLLSVLVACFSPLFLQQSFAVSADVVTNAATIAAITVFVSGPSVATLDVVLLAVLGLMAAHSKPVLAPLFFGLTAAPFLLYQRRQGLKDRRRWAWSLLIGGVLVVVCIVSAALASRMKNLTNFEALANPQAQMQFIAANPALVASAIGDALMRVFDAVSWTSYLGWLDTAMPGHLTRMWTRLLCLGTVIDALLLAALARRRWLSFATRRDAYFDGFRRVPVYSGLLVLGIASMVASVLAMYLTFTPVGLTRILGMQQRYFFPTLFTTLIMFAPFAQLREPKPGLSASSDSAPVGRDIRSNWMKFILISAIGSQACVYVTSAIAAIMQRYH